MTADDARTFPQVAARHADQDDQQQAAEVLGWLPTVDLDRLSGQHRREVQRVTAALAAARAEGYRAAVEESRQFCARSGGCIS